MNEDDEFLDSFNEGNDLNASYNTHKIDTNYISQTINSFEHQTKVLFSELNQKHKKESQQLTHDFIRQHQKEYQEINNYFSVHETSQREHILFLKSELNDEFAKLTKSLNHRHQLENKEFIKKREEEKNELLQDLTGGQSESVKMAMLRKKNGILVPRSYRSDLQTSKIRTRGKMSPPRNQKSDEDYVISGENIRFNYQSQHNSPPQQNSQKNIQKNTQAFFLSHNRNTLFPTELQKGNFKVSKKKNQRYDYLLKTPPKSTQKQPKPLQNHDSDEYTYEYQYEYEYEPMDEEENQSEPNKHLQRIRKEKDGKAIKHKTIKEKDLSNNSQETKQNNEEEQSTSQNSPINSLKPPFQETKLIDQLLDDTNENSNKVQSRSTTSNKSNTTNKSNVTNISGTNEEKNKSKTRYQSSPKTHIEITNLSDSKQSKSQKSNDKESVKSNPIISTTDQITSGTIFNEHKTVNPQSKPKDQSPILSLSKKVNSSNSPINQSNQSDKNNITLDKNTEKTNNKNDNIENDNIENENDNDNDKNVTINGYTKDDINEMGLFSDYSSDPESKANNTNFNNNDTNNNNNNQITQKLITKKLPNNIIETNDNPEKLYLSDSNPEKESDIDLKEYVDETQKVLKQTIPQNSMTSNGDHFPLSSQKKSQDLENVDDFDSFEDI